MYADDPLVLELLALLKAHGVVDIVISPGSRHYAYTRSLEHDQDYRLHSVVDERSAGFYALGISQATRSPVALLCTSGTAGVNYGSAIAEAFHQGVPLIALTTDRLSELRNQAEDQMIDQRNLFEGFIRYTALLKPVNDDYDRWYCNREINEALLEARKHGGGPVHLNIPVASHTSVDFSTYRLPTVRVITRHELPQLKHVNEELAQGLSGRRVLLLWGQGRPLDAASRSALDAFCEAFDVAIMADHLSNLSHAHRIRNPLALLRTSLKGDRESRPDLVITLGGNAIFSQEVRKFLEVPDIEHWRIDRAGRVSDPFRRLTRIFEMGESTFFAGMSAAAHDCSSTGRYVRHLQAKVKQLPEPDSDYGEFMAVRELLSRIPPYSVLHVANSAPVRMALLSEVDETVEVHCNRGVNGIDGCMSTAIGFAAVDERPTFLVIGDLAFIYDLNSLLTRGLSVNLRILLVNNGGGAVMHAPLPENYHAAASQHVAAGHHLEASGWSGSIGIDYRCAASKLELMDHLAWLTEPDGSGPRMLEAFTERISDIGQLKRYYSSLRTVPPPRDFSSRLRRFGGRTLRRAGLR